MTLESIDSFTARSGTADFDSLAAELGLYSSPELIASPTSTAEIAAALAYAQAHGLDVAVRSGGHGGFAATDNTLLLDLRAFADVEVLDSERVRVGTGAVWGEVATALAPHGLAISSGDTYTVGVGGLTLGGGVGWMVRQYGLALDSLVEAEVVLVSGEVVTASHVSEAELFWALRGGGGNFGVVTSFTFQAHPLPSVVAGSITLDPGALDRTALAITLKAWRDVMRSAPAALNVTYLGMPAFGPDAPATSTLLVVFGGDNLDEASAAIEPLLALPAVLSSDIAPKSYVDVLERMEKPEGEITMVDNNSFADNFSDSLIDDLAAAHESFGAAVLMIRYLRGALNDIPVDATAFAHRGSEVLLISAAFLGPDAPAGADTTIRARWSTLGDRTSGLYGNFSPTIGEAITARMYPPATLDRLRAAKRTYDPSNLLRQNHNVLP